MNSTVQEVNGSLPKGVRIFHDPYNDQDITIAYRVEPFTDRQCRTGHRSASAFWKAWRRGDYEWILERVY